MSTAFLSELSQWGPDAPAGREVSLADAEAYCRRLARTHYENFPVVSWLLPRRLHQHFYNVYAYCRWADDLGDEVSGAERSLELLAWWREQLTACYEAAGNALCGVPPRPSSIPAPGVVTERHRGRSLQPVGERNPKRESRTADHGSHTTHDSPLTAHQHPVFVALTKTIKECHIPRQPFEDLISAFAQDQRVHEYDTFEQLLDYCRRSANPVGRLVLYVCGHYSEQNAAWADSICTGLQLANFWQDVARDLDIGRVYLPREDRERFGYSEEDLRARVTNEAFLALMRFEVDRARESLRAGLPLVERLPGRLQIDIELFARGGLKILDRIEAAGYRVWETRPVVTKRQFAALFFGCVARAFRRRACPWKRVRRN